MVTRRLVLVGLVTALVMAVGSVVARVTAPPRAVVGSGFAGRAGS
jgi:hypothetical protein